MQALNELLEDDEKFGFIVMDGSGTLYGTVSGNTREVLHKFTVREQENCRQYCGCTVLVTGRLVFPLSFIAG